MCLGKPVQSRPAASLLAPPAARCAEAESKRCMHREVSRSRSGCRFSCAVGNCSDTRQVTGAAWRACARSVAAQRALHQGCGRVHSTEQPSTYQLLALQHLQLGLAHQLQPAKKEGKCTGKGPNRPLHGTPRPLHAPATAWHTPARSHEKPVCTMHDVRATSAHRSTCP